MPGRFRLAQAFAAASLVASIAAGAAPGEPRGVYAERCASCHGAARYGGYAPPLIPDALARKSDEALAAAIRNGLPSTQMPAFAGVLDEAAVRALVGLLREPVGEVRWGAEEIAASRVEQPPVPGRIPAGVRRENLTLVVERGSGQIAVLDGDTLRELDRFEVGLVHGGPKFDRELRRVFAATRDGTVARYDLVPGRLHAKVKVAVNTRNLAASPGGDFVAVANQLPASLAILDAELRPLRVLPLPGQPSAVFETPGAASFLVALRDAPSLLEVSYPDLSVRTLAVPDAFEDLTPVPGSRRLLASSRGGKRLLLYDLDAEVLVASLDTEGLPHLFSACFFEREGRLHAAFSHVGAPRLSVVELASFRVVKELPLRGAGYFVRTHPATPYLWADTNTEAIQLVDKASLELAPTALVPEAGKTAMHVEFTAEGDRALVSVWHEQGAVVAYDSKSLREVARLPYAMPVGKYNAWNKTRVVP